ncbi:hypothetical protein [Taklimakanibacter albus]|uniref:Uncharacterized protein n=1 Tax=Taklimakanibacter albus TaxID=2800327 RepID=A0ACC5R7C5_9HYPH|nr:hypothetical protein [Aestuariivirga sp. YIM B02566]MBK1868268.1 hypothetical protein [Aestuariivirga sp. YIM B02566]
MTSFNDFVLRDLRLCLLRALAEQPGYTANEVLLQKVAAGYGMSRTREVIRTELNFLADVSAITVVNQGSYAIATLHRRGQDHVDGLIEIAGVKKPSPKE